MIQIKIVFIGFNSILAFFCNAENDSNKELNFTTETLPQKWQYAL